LKNVLKITALTMVSHLLICLGLIGQSPSSEDYKIYTAIIRSEIPDTAKSIAILNRGIGTGETFESTSWLINSLKSKDSSGPYNTYDVFFWTEDYKKERPAVIDSVSRDFLIDYCGKEQNEFSFSDQFHQTFKTFIIDKSPIKYKSVDKSWRRFYKKYPGSWGIFSFSKISYYHARDKSVAANYYWHRRGGLNGHGAVVVLEKMEEEWSVKYKIYLWWN
jgi:hypothetical protein